MSFGLAISSVYANELEGVYVGGGIGKTSGGLSAERDMAFKVFGGIKLNEQLAVEAQYINFGEGKTTSKGVDLFTRKIVENTSKVTNTSFGASGVYIYPVQDKIDALVKIGLHFWDRKDDSTSLSSFVGDAGVSLFYTAGVNYEVAENISLRGEYEIYGGNSLSVISGGVVYKF